MLTPMHAGSCRLGADHVWGGGRTAEERVPFVIYAFLVEGPDGERALVDLGPVTLDYANAMFRRHGFFRDLGEGLPPADRFPDDIVQPHGNVFTQLAARGLVPADIGHIVFTHLHADHHGIDDATDGGAAERFPGAVLHVSRRGWEDNLASRRDGAWASYVDHAFGDFLLRREREGRVRFEDDAEVFRGLRTMYLGGHSVCSQAVIVDTTDGAAIIASDDIYLYELLERGVIPQIRTSEEAYRRAIERIVALAERVDGVIVPLHDPLVWEAREEHGKRWLRALRPHSRRAIEGWRRRHPRGRENP